jgi:hypothetical protein
VGAATDDGGDELPEPDQRHSEAIERTVRSSRKSSGNQRVQSLLVDCKYMHVHRGGNEVAHTLAQHARRCHENAVVRLEAPECVRELIRREAAGRVTPAYACNRSVP